MERTTLMGSICHDCGFYSSVLEKRIVSHHEAITTKTTIHKRWGQLHLSAAPPEAASMQGRKNRKKENVLLSKRNIPR